MTREDAIIELGSWLRTPPGGYVMAWEQDLLDHAVTDAFGYHAVQLGMPELEGLRANRMPHRWVVSDSLVTPEPLPRPMPPLPEGLSSTLPAPDVIGLRSEFDALPFPSASLDLVLLPHALELARDPHQTLREVERVLVPEGRVVIAGFNPASLWGLRQRLGHMRGVRRLQPKEQGTNRTALYLPSSGEFIGYWRLRDWLRLLGFEVQVGRFGCWRAPVSTEKWLDRFAWMDRVGERWWPVLGAVYVIMAVKRVPGMRLVGRVKGEKRKTHVAPAVVANRNSDKQVHVDG
jgi:SAM-dependent methyltransferase